MTARVARAVTAYVWVNRHGDAVMLRPLSMDDGAESFGLIRVIYRGFARREQGILCTSGSDPLRHAGRPRRPIMTLPQR